LPIPQLLPWASGVLAGQAPYRIANLRGAADADTPGNQARRFGVRRDLATRQLSTTLTHCDHGRRQHGMLESELVTEVARNEGFVA
jgi:hypothetical protein